MRTPPRMQTTSCSRAAASPRGRFGAAALGDNHRMTRLRASRRLARLVLAWFALFVVVGSAAPWMQPGAAEAVCSAAGVASLPAGADGHDDGGVARHSIECPLCLPLFVPPTPGVMVQSAPIPSDEPSPRPIATGLVVSAAAAPLPARGPPPVA